MFFEKHVFQKTCCLWESKVLFKKIKNREKKNLGAPTPPEDEAICLFAGLLANPDMPLNLCVMND